MFKINTYRKQNDELMIYINNLENGVSIGLSEDRGFSPYGKYTTKGQRNTFYQAMDAFDKIPDEELAHVGELEYEEHAEEKIQTDIGNIFITDIATVCGVKVGSDGAYLHRNGKLFDISNSF